LKTVEYLERAIVKGLGGLGDRNPQWGPVANPG